MNISKTDPMNDMFTMFVLSMVMTSLLFIPSIIAAGQAMTTWRHS